MIYTSPDMAHLEGRLGNKGLARLGLPCALPGILSKRNDFGTQVFSQTIPFGFFKNNFRNELVSKIKLKGVGVSESNY